MPVLRSGSSGAYVYMLQLALRRAGYQLELDGKFGANTARAVTSFQSERGLSPDGIVGPLTWAALTPNLTGYVIHTVRRGDTFSRLASAYGSTVFLIDTANPGADPLNLTIGSELVIPFDFQLVPTDIPFSSALTDFIVKGLTMRYPFIGSFSAGMSVMGRRLNVLRIGEGPKKLFINASHHANEWITTPLVLSWLENLAKARASGGSIGEYNASELLSRAELYVMPLVNPDGLDLVTGAISPAINPMRYSEALAISRRYPAIPFPDGWKANIAGTDLNLQYPAGWAEAREIKYAQGFTSPAPRDFVGTSALSSPESRAVYSLSLEQDFDMSISYHSQGRVIYWRYLDREPPRSREIGLRLAEVSGYALEDTPQESGYAGYKDWFIDYYNRPGYTVEVGLGRNPLPLTQFDEIYAENAPLMTTALFETGTL